MPATKRKRGSSGAESTSASSPRRSRHSPKTKSQAVTNTVSEADIPQAHNDGETEIGSANSSHVNGANIATDDNDFTVFVSPKGQAKKSKGQRDGATVPADDDDPAGAKNLGVSFVVTPGNQWDNKTRYRKFMVPDADGGNRDDSNSTFMLGEFVFVNHDMNATSDKSGPGYERQDWVAQVREIRATSPEAVFVRVAWMYWPDELPNGRQPYHGEKELVASNHMDIIDAMTVDGKANVVRLSQGLHDKSRNMSHFGNLDEHTYYWRQTYNVARAKGIERLSKLPKDCVCNRVSSLDERLFHCPHSDCQRWFHEKCLLAAAKKQYYAKRVVTKEQGRIPDAEESRISGVDNSNDIKEVIVATPVQKRGLLNLFGLGGITSPQKAITIATTPPGVEQSEKGSEKPDGKPGPDTKSPSNGNADTAAPGGKVHASLVVRGGKFIGQVNILEGPATSDEDAVLKVLDTVEVLCLSKKCRKSFTQGTAKPDLQSQTEVKGEAEEPEKEKPTMAIFDAVRDAANRDNNTTTFTTASTATA